MLSLAKHLGYVTVIQQGRRIRRHEFYDIALIRPGDPRLGAVYRILVEYPVKLDRYLKYRSFLVSFHRIFADSIKKTPFPFSGRVL